MLLKSINYWSFPGGLEMQLDPMEALRLAKKHRFDAIELCVGPAGSALGTDVSEDRCKELRAEADRLGLTIPSVASGLYWERSLGDADPAKRDAALEDLRAMLRIANWLGAKTLLTIPGSVDVFFLPERPPQPYDEVFTNARDGLRKVLPLAEEFNVRIGIENVWNKFLLSPGEMRYFVEMFESPWIGAYVDVANLMPFGHPEDWLRTLGKNVVGIHFKDFRRSAGTIDGFVDLLEGDVPWPALMEAIAEIGYTGPVVAEMIPGYRHHPEVRVANASNAMDAILGRTNG